MYIIPESQSFVFKRLIVVSGRIGDWRTWGQDCRRRSESTLVLYYYPHMIRGRDQCISFMFKVHCTFRTTDIGNRTYHIIHPSFTHIFSRARAKNSRHPSPASIPPSNASQLDKSVLRSMISTMTIQSSGEREQSPEVK